MNPTDHANSPAVDFASPDSTVDTLRRKAHAAAYTLFVVGAITAWLRAGYDQSDPMEAFCLLAVVWFPAVIVEAFRAFGISNYVVAAPILAGICGYDGIMRLLHAGWSGC